MSGQLSLVGRLLRKSMGIKGSMAMNPKGRLPTDVDKTDGKVDWDPIALQVGGYSKHNVPATASKHYHYNKVVPHMEHIPKVTFWDERRLGKMIVDAAGKRVYPKTPEEAIANGADPKVIRSWGPYWNQCLENSVPDYLIRHDYVKATSRLAGRVPVNPEFIPLNDGVSFHSDKLGVLLNVNRYTVFSPYCGSAGYSGFYRAGKVVILFALGFIMWHIHFVDHRFPLILDWKFVSNLHDIYERERRMVRDGLDYEDVFRPSKIPADE